MVKYPMKLEPDTNGTLLVSFEDIPEAHTFGDDEQEALARAVDALETALSMYVDARRPIPEPSPVKRGRKSVTLPVLTEAKLALYETMRQAGVGKAELARRLNWHMPQVDRLLDVLHASKLDQIEAGFAALGKRLEISIRDAACRGTVHRRREGPPAENSPSRPVFENVAVTEPDGPSSKKHGNGRSPSPRGPRPWRHSRLKTLV